MRIAVACCRAHPTPSPSNAAYIAALASAGVEPVVALWNADPIARFLDCDATVLRQTWDYQDDPGGYAAWHAEMMRSGARIFNPPEIALWNNDKRTLRSFAAAGFATPATELVDPSDPEAAARRLPTQKVVLKPAIGGSGVGVVLTRQGAVRTALMQMQAEAPGRPTFVQEFLPEIADGELRLCFAGGAFSHAVRARPGEGEFRTNGRFTPEITVIDPPTTAVEAASGMLAHLGADLLYARIDGVMRDGHFICTEIELTDPDLHLHIAPGAADRLAQATLARLGRTVETLAAEY